MYEKKRYLPNINTKVTDIIIAPIGSTNLSRNIGKACGINYNS